jgi:glycosyltransferase involved in cell wall biosynthesis
MIIISDLLKGPIDEGAKKSTYNLIKQLRLMTKCSVISVNTGGHSDLSDKYLCTNKMLINKHFYEAINHIQDKKILYIPESSITPLTFIRAFHLKMITGKQVYVLGLQPREYDIISRRFLRYIQPDHIITQPLTYSCYLTSLGIKNTVLPLGVDLERFNEIDATQKSILRKKYSLTEDSLVLLHIGHITKGRNLQWLIDIKKHVPEVEILIVSSSYSSTDRFLYRKIKDVGIKIFTDYLDAIDEAYNVADCYIFPVQYYKAAIGTPLSVLEAMACNLIVFTTSFGSLPDTFKKDNSFHYVNSSRDIINMLEYVKSFPKLNREKVMRYTWENVARRLMEIIN